MTLLTASRKSFSVTVFLLALMAYIPASVHTLLMSAPEFTNRNPNIIDQNERISITVALSHLNLICKTRKSLPVEFGQRRARSSKRMSLSQFIVRVWILKIWVLLSRSGSPNSTFRSSLPGRNSAGSSVSGLQQKT